RRARENMKEFWAWLEKREEWFYRDLPMVNEVRWFYTVVGEVYTLENWAAFDDEAAFGRYRAALANLRADEGWDSERASQEDRRARQQNVSLDEEDGSQSLRVDFLTDFTRPAGYHVGDTEWYVLEGEIAVGSKVLGAGGYFHAPKGVAMPTVAAREGTRILLYREYGDWGFHETHHNATWA